MSLKSGLCIVGLTIAVAWNASADVPVGSKVPAVDFAKVEYERQLQTEAAEQRRLELRQSMVRAAAHANMPSTMYASTPSDAIEVPHAIPGLKSRHDPIIDLVMPLYLQSVKEAESKPFSQRLNRVLRTALTVDQSPGDVFSRDRMRSQHRGRASFRAPAHGVPDYADRLVIPYFPSASNPTYSQGQLRLVNRSTRRGTVTLEATDDEGRIYPPISVSIDAASVLNLSSMDLERGNPEKGLAAGTGPGQGAWVLSLSSTVPIEAHAFIQTPDGYLTSIIDKASRNDNELMVIQLGTAMKANTQDYIRLVNLNSIPADALISRFGERESPPQTVTIELPAHHARTYLVEDLANGTAPGVAGSLDEIGNHSRVAIETVRGVLAMSFSVSHAGHLTNLSGLTSRDSVRSVPLFMSASDPHRRQSVLRLLNRESRPGTVNIQAFDDTGRTYEVVTLALAANGVAEIDSDDLELGNATKYLSGHTGRGVGDWRLELVSDLDLEILTFVETDDGVLSPMLDTVARDQNRHDVGMFKAVDDSKQIGLLRLMNTSAQRANITMQGMDDLGVHHGIVRLTLASAASRTLTAINLESGDEDLDGMLGDGSGEWRLAITSNVPIEVMNLVSSPTGHLSNLSTSMSIASDEEETAESLFNSAISKIVQDDCVNCHVAGGVARNARLVFVTDGDPDHLTKNLNAFKLVIDEVDDGADLILNRIQGVGHPPGVRIRAGTDEFAAMERFLELLGGEVDEGSTVTVATLFDGVTMESHRQTLRRAAILFAGRVPTENEYASLFEDDEESLRNAIRGLMHGPGFHDFLIRASNDRLLTDRDDIQGVGVIDPIFGYFVDYNNLNYEKRKSKDPQYSNWRNNVDYGIRRAPLELIAYVVENDLPYTEILTADYIMANPMAAEAYGAKTEFLNYTDIHEFRPSEIASYYRSDDSKVWEYSLDLGTRVINPGDLATDYPHAGILNTTVFLKRYPTTATNRNRARSRWTYYHFLGTDIEKSASRTTDPVALADTNNPTMNNAACVVCHQVMDPVAGAYQNYDEIGYYRSKWGGLDSLDDHYKDGATTRQNLSVGARTWENRETLTVSAYVDEGENAVALATASAHNILVDYLSIRDVNGNVIGHYELEELDGGDCGTAREGQGMELIHCPLIVPIELPKSDAYVFETAAYIWYDHDETLGRTATLSIWVPYAQVYQHGDTWYRGMRAPGFDNQEITDADTSLPWLAERIVDDLRFAEATVKFWWPAIMGYEVVNPPEDGDPDFDSQLLTSFAQLDEVERLTRGFQLGFTRAREFDLKDLLTEIVLTPWFRAAEVMSNDNVRDIALSHAGANRLLTPEELSHKTLALTGFGWDRRRPSYPWWGGAIERLDWTAKDAYGLLYGGIDSGGIAARARDMTPIMAGVAKRHAAVVACPVVMKDIYLDEGDDRLFSDVNLFVSPSYEFGASFEIEAEAEMEEVSVTGRLNVGLATAIVYLENELWDDDSRAHLRRLYLDKLVLRNSEGTTVQMQEFEEIDQECTWDAGDTIVFWHTCPVEVLLEIPSNNEYEVAVYARATQGGDELARLRLVIETDTEGSVGEMVVKEKIAELHEKLLGEGASSSPNVEDTYGLFVKIWKNERSWQRSHFDMRCDWTSDQYYLNGLLNDAWLDPSGDEEWDWERHGYDQERVNAFFDTIEMTDPHYIARTWVAVLAYLLTDFRYLYL